jgi:hypothetical protein
MISNVFGQPKLIMSCKTIRNRLDRVLYKSLLSTSIGKLIVSILLLILFTLGFSGFREFYSAGYMEIFVAIIMGSLMFSFSLIALWYFDRREREPWQLRMFAVLSVILFFGPVSSACLEPFRNTTSKLWASGFIEEFWKVTPLLLIWIFIPRAVSGTRDGLIYGSLGGFGFAVFEYVSNVIVNDYPISGSQAFINNLGSATLFGTHNYIIWSAIIGATIGWATMKKRGNKMFILPVITFIGISILHIINVKEETFLTTSINENIIYPLINTFSDAEQFIKNHSLGIQILSGTAKFIIINCITLPVLYIILIRSGNRERIIIQKQLATESTEVITRYEFVKMATDRRLQTRRILNFPRTVSGRIIQLQNELALQKEIIERQGGDPDNDLAVISLRKMIVEKRQGL